MESILSSLYHGQISPEQQYTPKTKEFQALQQAHLAHYDDFIQQLSPALTERFSTLMDNLIAAIPLNIRICLLTASA